MDVKKVLEDENRDLSDILNAKIKLLYDHSKNDDFPTDFCTRTIFLKFYKNTLPENLRRAAMMFICKIQELQSNSPLVKFDDIIRQAIFLLDCHVVSSDEQFKCDFVYGKVPNELYNNCLKIVIYQDVEIHTNILDQLFSIKCPESKIKCITVCVHVKSLINNEKTNKSGLKWIELYGIDTSKYSDNEKSYIEAINELWQESVKYTVTQVKKFYPENSLEEYRTFILVFFQRCEKKPLRIAVMELIVSVREALKEKMDILSKKEKGKENGLNRRSMYLKLMQDIIMLIISEFERFMSGKADEFIENCVRQKVPEQLWKNCVESVKDIDINKCFTALNLLLSIFNPESGKREAFIAKVVKSMIHCDTAFMAGVQWTFTFNLLYLKKIEFENIVYKMYLLEKETDVLPLIQGYDEFRYLQVLKIGCRQTEKNSFKSELAENFVKHMDVKKLNAILQEANYQQMLAKYGKSNPLDHNTSVYKTIKINSRENDLFQHKLGHALQLLDSEPTFKTSIDNFKKLDLFRCPGKNIDCKSIDKIIYKALIYPKCRSLISVLFKSMEDKLYYVWMLDTLCSRYHKNELHDEDELEIKRLYTLEELVSIFFEVVTKYKIDVDKNLSFAWKMVFYYSMKTVYNSWSINIFGFCALHTLKNNDYLCDPLNQHNIFDMIQGNKRYAYCWAQYLGISKESLPSYLKPCECLNFSRNLRNFSKYLTPENFYKAYSADKEITISCMTYPFENFEDYILTGKNFIKMVSDSKSFSENEDSIIECTFEGKTYEFISVKSSQALEHFVVDYLSKADTVGIDTEFGKSVNVGKEKEKYPIATLQISTEKWLCVIDVQEICKEITNEHPLWKKFLLQLFDPSILGIGFAFHNDFNCLFFTFPWLQQLEEENKIKVFCLQKLTNTILASQLAQLKNFFSKNIKETCSLAKLSEEVTGYEMDKTMQTSNWTERSLTPFQKIYAVLDAVIVLGIYNKLLFRLKEKLGSENDVTEFIKEGYVWLADEEPKS